MRQLLRVVAVLVALAFPRLSWASDEMVTDRPDVAESSKTVGALRFQAEMGFDFEHDDTAGVKNNGFRTPIKLRFGIIDPLEIHVETPGFAFNRVESAPASPVDDTGFADMGVGFKFHIFDQRGIVPSTGVLFTAILPIGTSPATRDLYALAPILAMDWDIGTAWGIGTNVGFSIPVSDRSDNKDAILYALAVGRSFAPAVPELGAYVEFFGESEFGGESALFADGGFAWQVKNNLQLDIYCRFGLNDIAPDFGAGGGVSFKI